MNQPPLYSPLGDSEIRLLEILEGDEVKDHGDATRPVRCRLAVASLSPANHAAAQGIAAAGQPPFCALSYVWGDPTDTKDIVVNGHVVPITTSLEAALRHVRTKWAAHRRADDPSRFRLWADAICINQSDMDERGRQVQLMGDIYRSADLVLAWLGQDDVDLALRCIGAIAAEIERCLTTTNAHDFLNLEWTQRCPELCEPAPFARTGTWSGNMAWEAIIRFFELPYWTRVWIFQEVVLANELLLVTQHSSLGFDRLEGAAVGMLRVQEHINETTMPRPEWISLDSWVVFLGENTAQWDLVRMAWSVRTWVREAPSRAAEGDQGSLEVEWNRWDLSLNLGRRFKATDARDHVYGLLGVSGLQITPDYSSSSSAGPVYIEFATKWLDAYRLRPRDVLDKFPLLFLSYAGVGLYGESPGLPSWAPNFSKEAQSGSWKTRMDGCLMADKGVFNSTPNCYPVIRGSSLFVRGVKLEKVAVVAAPISHVWADGELLTMASDFKSRHPTYAAGHPPLQAFCQTINAAALPGSERKAVVDSLAFLIQILRTQSDATATLLALGFDAEQESFEGWLVRNFCFGSDPPHVSWPEGDLLRRLDSDGEFYRGIEDLWSRLRRKTVDSGDSWRLFETTDGYLGHAPAGVAAGDIVCVLEGGHIPVLLRKVVEHDYYQHVGTVFVLGFMAGEATTYVDLGISALEMLEIR